MKQTPMDSKIVERVNMYRREGEVGCLGVCGGVDGRKEILGVGNKILANFSAPPLDKHVMLMQIRRLRKGQYKTFCHHFIILLLFFFWWRINQNFSGEI